MAIAIQNARARNNNVYYGSAILQQQQEQRAEYRLQILYSTKTGGDDNECLVLFPNIGFMLHQCTQLQLILPMTALFYSL